MGAPTTDRGAIQQIIRALREAGWHTLLVNNGEEEVKVSGEQDALAEIMDVDEATLVVVEGHPKGTRGWVYFVLGNEPFEVAADYTVNLEAALAPVFDRWDS